MLKVSYPTAGRQSEWISFGISFSPFWMIDSGLGLGMGPNAQMCFPMVVQGNTVVVDCHSFVNETSSPVIDLFCDSKRCSWYGFGMWCV